MKNYTVAELAMLLKVSERTILRQIQTLSDKLKNTYSKDFTIGEDLKEFIFSDKIQTDFRQNLDSENEELIDEWFTPEEHDKFNSIIFTEYPVMKKQIEMSDENLIIAKETIASLEKQIDYFRMSYHRQLDIHEKLIESFRERNFIEAKEKGFDKNTSPS